MWVGDDGECVDILKLAELDVKVTSHMKCVNFEFFDSAVTIIVLLAGTK